MIPGFFHSRILVWSMSGMLCLVIFVACGPQSRPVIGSPSFQPLPQPSPASTPLFVDWVLRASGKHFNTYPVYENPTFLPSSYQAIVYPGFIQSELNTSKAHVVQLPDAQTQAQLWTTLGDKSVQLNNSAFDAELYAFDRSAISENLAYFAAPVKNLPNFDFENGVQAGVLYDNLGFYGYGERIFNVWLFTDHIELRDGQGNGMFKAYAGEDISGTVYYYMQKLDQPVSEPLVVFLKNGCWCCWTIFNINGCLICTRN